MVLCTCAWSDAALTGPWGGEHIGLTLTAGGGRVELDCGHGRIDEPVRIGTGGTFEARGTYVAEAGGPLDLGVSSTARGQQPAVYKGRVAGRNMRLTIVVPETGREIGTFSLCSGCPPHLERCL